MFSCHLSIPIDYCADTKLMCVHVLVDSQLRLSDSTDISIIAILFHYRDDEYLLHRDFDHVVIAHARIAKMKC